MDEESMGCWGCDQAFGVGVRSSGVHLYRYGTVSGALGCKVVGSG